MSNGKMSDFSEIINKIVAFRDKRDWKQFHNPKDMALSLTLEAAELLEHFQWKGAAELEKYVESHKEEIGDELADVLYWVLLMSHDFDIDILEAAKKKLRKTAVKYPVAKSKGNSKKYTRL